MNQLYHIAGYSPAPGMGSAGFAVKLFPAWKCAVAAYTPAITQANVNRAIENMGRHWLDGHGYNALSEYDGKKEPLYRPRTSLRVSWGVWGPEHIDVPGNACGLDIFDGIGATMGGKILQPHNVDCVRQASLLLTIFLFFADTFVLDRELAEYRERKPK